MLTLAYLTNGHIIYLRLRLVLVTVEMQHFTFVLDHIFKNQKSEPCLFGHIFWTSIDVLDVQKLKTTFLVDAGKPVVETTWKEIENLTEVEVELKRRLGLLTDHLIQKQSQVRLSDVEILVNWWILAVSFSWLVYGRKAHKTSLMNTNILWCVSLSCIQYGFLTIRKKKCIELLEIINTVFQQLQK